MRTLIGLLMGAVLLCGIGATVYDRNTQATTAETVLLDTVPMGNPQSVVRVEKAGKGHGTGFYIGNGQFITAGHVAAMTGFGGRLTIKYQAGEKTFETTAYVVWIDTVRDTALLQSDTVAEMLTAQGLAPANMACEVPNDPIGTSIVSIGYPLSLGLRYAWGHVASGTMTMGGTDPSTYIGSDLSLAEGNSGGPVFDRHGFIVGMSDAYARHNTMSMLIPRSELCAALKDAHPAPQTNPDGTPTS